MGNFMSEQKPGVIGSFFRFIYQAFRFVRNTVLNLLFLILLTIFVVAIMQEEDQVTVTDKAALVLNIDGALVEEKTWVDPLSKAINQGTGSAEENPEVLVRDVVKVVREATKDSRIQAMVLRLDEMSSGSMDKLQAIGVELEKFKAAGKKIYATGSYYTQGQYFLASYADSINLQPMGTVMLEGYGTYPMYYKAALEKLQISTHVFKVGTYKSAVEPFTRNDMSPEAKEANKAWLDELWGTYKQQVAARRGFDVNNFDETYASLLARLKAADGDMTKYALDAKLVDTSKTRQEFRKDLIEIVGEDKENHTFNQVNFDDYLSLVQPKHAMVNPLTDKVAIVVARGSIIDGKAKAGTIGGDSTSDLLRRAREDDKVKAVVLRIDSGGGSAFASEVIAEEIRALKAAGKPVVASMGAVAASGGYWIAAPADEIYAAPTTITGSIGIFALLHTAENVMSTIGVNVDGVGTTELSGLSSGVPLFKGLRPEAAELLQSSINHGYDQFLTHVATNRKMDKAAVDKIAQGRVWTGKKALELGLVDKLGTFEDAIAAAAEKASLKQYDVQVIEQELSEEEQLMQNLFGAAANAGLLPQSLTEQSPLKKLFAAAEQQFAVLSKFNDPNGVYAFCFSCTIE